MVTLEYCGITETGKTTTEAKRKIVTHLTAMTQGSYAPTLIQYRGMTVIIYRHPLYGYMVSSVEDNHDGVRKVISTCLYPTTTLDEIIAEQKSHLAKCGWDGAEEISPLLDEKENKKFAQWVCFQHAYKYAISLGMTHGNAHQYASYYLVCAGFVGISRNICSRPEQTRHSHSPSLT